MSAAATPRSSKASTATRTRAPTPAGAKFARLGEFVSFINERHSIYLRRKAGAPKPWTEDPILRDYRFCNVYRELDTVSVYVQNRWVVPYFGDKDVWFLALIARHINWPPTLNGLPTPLPWSRGGFNSAMSKMEASGAQLFTGAYMINQSIPGGKGMKKYEYLAEFIFDKAWKQRELIRPRPGDTLEYAHSKLLYLRGLGSFMAAQVIADIRDTPTLAKAADHMDWAASGPGSRKGLNVVCGCPPLDPWSEEEWLVTLQALQPVVNAALPVRWKPLHAQNLQNCLCEFAKYDRGYSRSRYPGAQ